MRVPFPASSRLTASRVRFAAFLPLILLTFLLLQSVQSAAAQDARSSFVRAVPEPASQVSIGVIISQTGPAAQQGAQQLAAVQAFERRARGSRVALHNMKLEVRDDASSPRRALELAEELAEAGAHALICCTLADAAELVAPFAEQERIMTLSPAVLPAARAAEQQMLLVLPPDTLTVLRAVALAARSGSGSGQGVSMLALAGPAGDEARYALAAGALEAGIPLKVVEEFLPGQRPLTPEALLVAASQAAAVVVHAPQGEAAVAIQALRARGYEGRVFVPYVQLDALSSRRELGELVAVTSPALLNALPAGTPNQAAVSRYRQESGSSLLAGGPSSDPAGALLADALELLAASQEQALLYGVDPARLPQFRQALWDGLIGSGTLHLAAGSYRFDGRNPNLALAMGLVPARLQGSRLIAAE